MSSLSMPLSISIHFAGSLNINFSVKTIFVYLCKYAMPVEINFQFGNYPSCVVGFSGLTQRWH